MLHWLSGLVAPFERHPTRTFVAVGLLFTLAYVTAHVWFPKPPGRVIDGDALGYYAWLRSVVFDGDIDFSNDYRLLTDELAEDSGSLTTLASGLVPNRRPPGSALLWAPLFLAVLAGRTKDRADVTALSEHLGLKGTEEAIRICKELLAR